MRLRLAASLCLFALPMLACASTGGAGFGDGSRARDFMPLAVGNRWEYRVSPAPADKAVEEVRIVERDAKGFYVDSKGARFAPRTDGLFDGDRFLLQEPLDPGHTWIAVPRNKPGVVERFKILDTAARVEVPAGAFEGCVEVQASQEVRHPKSGKRALLTMTWTYAPHVGLVKAVGKVKPEDEDEQVASLLELLNYDVKPTSG